MGLLIKQNVLAHGATEEERLILAKAYDAYVKSEKSFYPAFTHFLTPAEAAAVRRAFSNCEAVSFSGGYDDSERVMAGFNSEGGDFPIMAVRLSGDFSHISHRDVLGSLMSLGIDRAVTGDILVTPDAAYIFCEERMAKYIAENLTSVSREAVKAEVVSVGEISAARQFDEIKKSVASERADAVVGALFSLSRADAAEAIARQEVMLNYSVLSSKDKRISSGDVISARGRGKAIVTFSGDLSKKGRLFILIKKYK